MFEGYIPQETFDLIRQHTPTPTVDGVIIKNNKILLMKRLNEPARGLYWSPGGRVRKYETIEHALKRNVYEETGLTVKSYEFITVVDQIFGLEHGVSLYYLVETDDVRIKLNDEHSDYNWYGLDELPLIHPYLHIVLDRVKELKNL